jgi:predicted dehydrogenase
MAPQRTIRWGIIGCGNVAEYKSGPALYRTPHSELVAVMRRDAAKAADFARRHGTRRWYTDVAALLADPEVDAVYIASPHYLHREHVTLAAQAHKIVLCEKPMGTRAADAQAIVDASKTNGVPLTVAYYRRFWQITRAMQNLLRDGAIGRVMQARVQLADYFVGDAERSWLTSREKSGGGALANAGSHWVDLLRFLLGEIVEVTAICSFSRFEIEDTIGIQMRTADGALVSLNVTLQSPVSVNEFDISGTEGRLLTSSLSDGRLILQRRGKEPETMQFTRSGVMHSELIAALVPHLLAEEPSPIPGEEAVAVWRIMEVAYRSCAEGGRVIVAPAE